jgi:hypothetical protein
MLHEATDFVTFAARHRLSGPRIMSDTELKEAVDDPTRALAHQGCKCDHPFLLVDDEDGEIRCHRCGRARLGLASIST